jgi:hypothetical protein
MSNSMSLLDALNRLNETDGHIKLEEKEPIETSTINGINKQANTNVRICFIYLN